MKFLSEHRRVTSVILVVCVFVLLGQFADRTEMYLVHAGFRGLPDFAFLTAVSALAYIVFLRLIYFGSTARRRIVCHSVAATITLLWLALLLAWSAVTESG